MKNDKSPDILDEMTKEEIIRWIRNSTYFVSRLPTKSSILFERWQSMERKLIEKERIHSSKLVLIDPEKKRDAYAKRFNESNDVMERVELARKIAPYDRKFKQWFDKHKELDREREKSDRLFKKYDEERSKEFKNTAA